MVVMSVQSNDCEFEAYYPDKRIEYITWMGSNSTSGYQMALSLRRFISKGADVFSLKEVGQYENYYR